MSKDYKVTELQKQCHDAVVKQLGLNVDIHYCECFETPEECVQFFREILEIKDEYSKIDFKRN